jgi:hypothetical protein
MGDSDSSKKHQCDAGFVEAGLEVGKTSRPLRNVHSNQNKVSRLRAWNIPSLPTHDDTVVHILVPSHSTVIRIQLFTN